MPVAKTLFNKHLGAAVRNRRVMAGLSQEAVGLQIGVTFQQIQKYERGVNRLSVESLILISAAINTSPHELIRTTLAAQGSQPIDTIEPPRARFRMESVRRLLGLPEDRQIIAVNVIKALEKEQAA